MGPRQREIRHPPIRDRNVVQDGISLPPRSPSGAGSASLKMCHQRRCSMMTPFSSLVVVHPDWENPVPATRAISNKTRKLRMTEPWRESGRFSSQFEGPFHLFSFRTTPERPEGNVPSRSGSDFFSTIDVQSLIFRFARRYRFAPPSPLRSVDPDFDFDIGLILVPFTSVPK